MATPRPVELVDWTNEEGSRFPPAMMASGVWAGALDRDWAYARTDTDGRRFGDELERIGYRGPAPCERRPFHAYDELHVEQGPLLERAACTIGVPRGIVCLHWYDVHVEGVANQVGPTPMEGEPTRWWPPPAWSSPCRTRRRGWAVASWPRSGSST